MLNYKNLDAYPEFIGKVTTTEFLAHYIFERIAETVHNGHLGQYAHGISTLRVTLTESPLARASYEGKLGH